VDGCLGRALNIAFLLCGLLVVPGWGDWGGLQLGLKLIYLSYVCHAVLYGIRMLIDDLMMVLN